MSPQVTAFGGLLLFSALVAVSLVPFVWRERPKTGASAMASSLVALFLWGLGQAVVVVTADLGLMLGGFTVTVAGTALVAVSWFVFCVQYTGRGRWITRRRLALLSVEPLVIIALSLTNRNHGLIWEAPVATTKAGTAGLIHTVGPALLGHVLYSYALASVGIALLVAKFFASRNVFRKRTFLFIVMSVAVILANASSIAGLSPLPHLTLVPMVCLGIGVIAALLVPSNRFLTSLPLERFLSVFGARSKSLAPVARDTAIEGLGSGFLVTDHKNRIVDINPEGRRIFDLANKRVVGQPLADVLEPATFLDSGASFLGADTTGEFSGVWVEYPDGTRHCFDATITALTDEGGELTGRVTIIHDVTEREQRKQKLEERTEELQRQNDQLDSFASIVSHDLRNPLNVASGRVELIEAKTEDVDDSIAETKKALGRMEEIIDDVLTLARIGQTIDETEQVALEPVAQDAWEAVETHGATLDLDLDMIVEGHDGRLAQVFENLFRNAVEHGSTGNQNSESSGDVRRSGAPASQSESQSDSDDAVEHGRDDVAITVGRIESGFYVEDDGPGIPDQHVDDVFGEGFTTRDAGTGFGLSITDTIVKAHGWDISVTTGTDGGARFEITGVNAGPE